MDERVDHWSGVGSTPVGLCAQAWRRKTDPSGADSSVDVKPVKSSPIVFGS